MRMPFPVLGLDAFPSRVVKGCAEYVVSVRGRFGCRFTTIPAKRWRPPWVITEVLAGLSENPSSPTIVAARSIIRLVPARLGDPEKARSSA